MDPLQSLPDDARYALAAYSAEYQPTSVECLGDAGGFSGAQFWRLQSSHGTLCLRRWPASHPTPERLEFIHSVLWYSQREGFDLVPVPIPTQEHRSYVELGGNLWELAPWMPGQADFHEDPRAEKMCAAMTSLARFHLAAAGFPVADAGPTPSPGVVARLKRLRELRSGIFSVLEQAIRDDPWPEIAACARRILQLAPQAAAAVQEQLETAAKLKVRIMPCIRDIWCDHVLFEGDQVTGLVDFGAMRPDNIAADVSRLLGSMARNSPEMWQMGREAYDRICPFEQDEHKLVRAMDHSSVLLSGLNWIEWIYCQQRTFDRPVAILGRMEDNEVRLRTLVGSLR